MQSIREVTPVLENVIERFSAPNGGLEYASEWSSNAGGLVVLSNSEDIDMTSISAERAMSVFLDILLPGLAFAVECGLKCLRCCDGFTPKQSHKLDTLFEDLRFILREKLQFLFQRVQEDKPVPDGTVVIPKIHEVFRTYSELYTNIRYRTNDSWVDAGRSAYFNLGLAADAIFILILSHESYADLHTAFEINVARPEQL